METTWGEFKNACLDEEEMEMVRSLHYWTTKSLKHCSLSSFYIFTPANFPPPQQPTYFTSATAGGMFICHSLSTEASWECTGAAPFASRTSTFWNGVEKGQRLGSVATMSTLGNRSVLGIQHNSKKGSQERNRRDLVDRLGVCSTC